MTRRSGVRVCGARCHTAKGTTCRCWCGGMFHGAKQESLRDMFRHDYGITQLPTTEKRFRTLTSQPDLFSARLSTGDQWRRWHDAAKEGDV